MWNVSQFESHFASLNADVLRLVRIDGSRPGKSNMKSAKILAQTDVSENYTVLRHHVARICQGSNFSQGAVARCGGSGLLPKEWIGCAVLRHSVA